MFQPRLIARCLAGVLLVSSITATSAAADELDATDAALTAAAPSGAVTVDVVTVNGSGCPAGTAWVNVAPDNTAFTVTYSDYTASAGAGTDPTDFRKNCQLGLRVNVPSGFTYAIAQADYRGYAFLERGATGLQRANYYFQGQSATATVSHYFSGYMDADWQTTDEVDVAALVFKPCGADINLNINTSLRVSAGTSNPGTTSVMTMDSTDGSVSTVYHFAWKACG
jgi:hypothetical protein